MRSLTACWLLILCLPAYAEKFETGNDVIDGCRRAASLSYGTTTAEALWAGKCTGVIQTLVGIGSHLSARARFCVPGEVTFQQAAKVFVKFLDSHPERLHELSTILAIDSLRATWPCKPTAREAR